jgi:hypothetical protein
LYDLHDAAKPFLELASYMSVRELLEASEGHDEDTCECAFCLELWERDDWEDEDFE